MSSFIANWVQVSVIVEACYRYEVPLPCTTTPTDLGQRLWLENVRSTAMAYPDDAPEDLPGSENAPYLYDHKPPYVPPPMEILKLVRWFAYQCNTYEGWQRTDACRIVTDLESACLAALGRETMPEPGTDPAWDAEYDAIPVFYDI